MNRRQLLERLSCGFGYLGLRGVAASAATLSKNPLAPKAPMFPARAKRVIFMYMSGAPSQYETFEYNPELAAAAKKGNLMAPAFEFTKSGQSGLPISNVFPHLQKQADEMCILNGMTTDSPAHPTATIQLHTGSFTFVRPSMGAWVVYGLGTENQDLPGFITINPAGQGGAQNFGSAFLPASYEGTPYTTRTGKLPNIANPEMMKSDEQRRQIDLIQSLNQDYLKQAKHDNELEGVIESYEMAFRMQTAVPGILDLNKETDASRKMYGLDNPVTKDFGTQCLLARRLAEAGVRFIEISANGWDHHNNLRQRMEVNAKQIDQPIAALIADLKQRGLLQDTLIVWGGEFGRTTSGQANDGRNHNNRGFSMWMAGGGVKGGFRLGATDPVSGSAIAGKVHMHDMHATMLYLLGMEHTRLTYRYGGRDFKLTDTAGNVVKEVMA